MICLTIDLVGSILFGICSTSWIYMFTTFIDLGKFSVNISSNIYPVLLNPSSSGTFVTLTACSFVIVPHDPGTLFHTSPFSLCCSGWIISIDLSQHSLISPVIISTLLVIWSSELFILVTTFFRSRISIWLFFITSISLLRFSIFHLLQENS